MLVRDERVLALGSTAELRAASPSARIVDAGGATVSPGLVDAHLHLVPWARARKQLELAACTSREEALERVRDHVFLGKGPFVPKGLDEALHFVTSEGERDFLPRGTPVYSTEGSVASQSPPASATFRTWRAKKSR